MFDIWHSARRYVETGELKLIASASAERLPGAANVPTIAESYPGVEVIAFNAIVAPGGTPAPIVAKLSADIRAVVESDAFRDKTKNLGINAYGNTPAECVGLDDARDRALEGRRPGRQHQGRLTAMAEQGAIDCDVHPTVPDNKALLPYLDDFWRDSVVARGINSLETISYPTKSPLTSRPEWRGKNGFAATDPKQLAGQVFDRWQAGTAILNCLYGVQLVYSEDMAKAFASAVNDWIVKEWLDRDSRLRASIVVPMQNVEYAVDEIERCAKDKRFVQVLVLCMQEVPLGRRHFWPIYAFCRRFATALPLGIHATSDRRNPASANPGWA